MITIGFITGYHEKSGTGSTGKPYTLYSFQMVDKDGNKLPGYYQCGFNKPACKDGDYVKLEVTAKGNNWEVTKDSIKTSKNPPAMPTIAEEKKSGGYKGGGGGGAKTTKSDLFGDIGGYNTEDDIRRMSYSAARTTATEVVKMLLEHDALKLVKADTKAGAASRFDLITAAVDKLTVEYFYDSATGRKLESVVDAGEPVPEGDGDLPDTTPEDLEEDDFDTLTSPEFEDDDDEFE